MSTAQPARRGAGGDGRADGVVTGRLRRIAVFLVIAYALAWLVCLPLWLAGQGLTQPLTTVCGVAMMATPTVSALVAYRMLGGGAPLVGVLGLRLGPWRRWLPYAIGAWLGPIVLALLALALAAAVGVYRVDLTHFSGFAEVITALAGEPPPLPMALLVALSLVQVLIGAVINAVPAMGEEMGWRGYLYDCLADRPAVLRIGVTGVAWGGWHAPLILLGYNYPALPPGQALLAMIAFTTALAAVLDWLRTGAGNVYVAGLAHGSVNAAAGVAVLFSAAGAPPDPATTGLLGWTGWLVLAVAALIAFGSGWLRHHRDREGQ